MLFRAVFKVCVKSGFNIFELRPKRLRCKILAMVNFENHYSLGVTFDGMIPARPKDVFGVVGWHNAFSDDLSSSLDDSSEGLEAFYRFQVTPWLQVSPDIQYLWDPGIEKEADDTLVLGLRALIHF